MKTIQLLPPLALDTQPPRIVAFLAEVAELPERSFPAQALDAERRKYLRKQGLIEKAGKGRCRLTLRCIDELRQLYAAQSDDVKKSQQGMDGFDYPHEAERQQAANRNDQDKFQEAPQHRPQKPRRLTVAAEIAAIVSILLDIITRIMSSVQCYPPASPSGWLFFRHAHHLFPRSISPSSCPTFLAVLQ